MKRLGTGGVIGAALVAIFLLMAIFGPWLAPYSPAQQNLEHLLELGLIGAHHRLRSGPLREEHRRDLVHPLVGGLRREDGGDQELPGVLPVQLVLRVGVLLLEARDHLFDALAQVPLRLRRRWPLAGWIRSDIRRAPYLP